jgi:hypothetical protein
MADEVHSQLAGGTSRRNDNIGGEELDNGLLRNINLNPKLKDSAIIGVAETVFALSFANQCPWTGGYGGGIWISSNYRPASVSYNKGSSNSGVRLTVAPKLTAIGPI